MSVCLTIDGAALTVSDGASVAAAVALAGTTRFRTSVTGQPRAPLCGMGVCFECRVRVDGRPVRSCQTTCAEGMAVVTDA